MPPLADDTDAALPSLEGLLASTVALMTAWADATPGGCTDQATQRRLLARKIVSNLFFIQHHPCASAPFRQVMGNAHRHWAGLAQPPGPLPADAPRAAADTPGVLH